MEIAARINPIKGKAMMVPTYVGSFIGFLGYLIFGAIPGLLYGGYMGVTMSSVLLGMPLQATLLSKIIVGGGMLLGLVSSLFFFVVVGALVGTVVGLPIMYGLKRVYVPVSAPLKQTD